MSEPASDLVAAQGVDEVSTPGSATPRDLVGPDRDMPEEPPAAPADVDTADVAAAREADPGQQTST